MKKIILITFIILSAVFTASSQSYLISAGGTVTACSGDFFDSGGSGGSYNNNENFTMTIHAPGPPNTHIKMIWNAFDVDPGDTLYIYDGPNTAAPLIGAYNNNNLPSSFTQASVYNTSGDLTFRFKSNGSITAPGFWGGFLCGPVCQAVIASMDTAATLPPPDDSNYIDICIGDAITFAALTSGPGAFPQNNVLYTQSAATSTYLWDLGDGTTATGPVVTHTYTLVRGYDVTLTITDVNGCTNANSLGLRVRVSANPFAQVNAMPDICSNVDTTYITLGYNISSSVIIEPITSHQSASQKYDSVTFIPDGPYCPPGCYNTNVTFNAFVPGQTITSASDILSVVVNIEHSFAGDLGFELICPNGQSVVLDGNDHSGGAALGIAYEPDGANQCDPSQNIQGTPWIYGWSQIYPQQGYLNNLDAMYSFPTAIPATDTINHNNYFTPDQSFSNLIGCPLNGTWNIQICDNWGSDNGYIFMWQLNLDPSLLPQGWGYTVPVDTVIWSGSFFTIINDTTIMVIPDSSGTYQYTVTVIDEFGCSYDTNLYLQVVQTPHVDLGTDTIICGNGIIYNLDAGPGDHFQWSTGANQQVVPVTSTGLYVVNVENYNMAGTLTCTDADTVFVKVLALPAADLGPDICVNGPVLLDAGNPGFNYIWNTGGATQTININTAGLYSVTVAEEFGFNCESVSDINVYLFPIPVISIGPDTTICRHHSLQLEVTDQNGYLDMYDYQYSWFPFPGSDRYIVLDWLLPQTYEVICTVTGCPGQNFADTLTLVVEPCDLEIPNIFTPNGDGYNDYFEIPNVEYYPNSTLLVYNRWGRKVYENPSYLNDWNGEDCADGVYYYIFTKNLGDHGDGLQTEQEHGMVTILR